MNGGFKMTQTQPWGEFGRFIKELRLGQKDMTQLDLARKLDKSASEVSRWLDGIPEPQGHCVRVRVPIQ